MQSSPTRSCWGQTTNTTIYWLFQISCSWISICTHKIRVIWPGFSFLPCQRKKQPFCTLSTNKKHGSSKPVRNTYRPGIKIAFFLHLYHCKQWVPQLKMLHWYRTTMTMRTYTKLTFAQQGPLEQPILRKSHPPATHTNQNKKGPSHLSIPSKAWPKHH